MVTGNPKLALFPLTAGVNNKGNLVIGGCDTVELAEEFGTPLYVFDELTLRGQCATFKKEFGSRYPETSVLYASKAFINRPLAILLKEEGLGLDVVSGGEMSIARAAGFDLGKTYFHGNNKTDEELRLALEWGVGRVVVDNFHELGRLNAIAGERGVKAPVLLRISPGIDPHTHRYNTTGIVDSKFGFLLARTEEAVAKALAAANLELVGLHFHLGSLILETDPYPEGIKVVLSFAAAMKQKYGFTPKELNIGGGFGVAYTLDAPAPPLSAFAEVIVATLKTQCKELKLPLPRLIIEPGRAIVARAGIALYHIGAVKEIPGVRTYVSVDGGMADNIRHAMYQARHEAIIANKVPEAETRTVTIAGKFCESGDILIRDITLAPVVAGDVLAVADCGAYCLSMASNYNASLKPAVVMVKDGQARLIRRRETFEDLTRCDVG